MLNFSNILRTQLVILIVLCFRPGRPPLPGGYRRRRKQQRPYRRRRRKYGRVGPGGGAGQGAGQGAEQASWLRYNVPQTQPPSSDYSYSDYREESDYSSEYRDYYPATQLWDPHRN